MQAMILAAGLGTRLRPWTLTHPKALVPVGGIPMLQRVIVRLKEEGFHKIVVNVHHFAEQIVDFLAANDFGVEIVISDERALLLDTGGAILNASGLFSPGPVLIHNVDILSNANLTQLMHAHDISGADATLLISKRVSTRKLVFDSNMTLQGWHNIKEDTYRPSGFIPELTDHEYAFSGIHVIGEELIKEMKRIENERKFSIIDFLLSAKSGLEIRGYLQNDLNLIDIGKPESLRQANL